MLICLFIFVLSISNYTRGGSNTSMQAAAPVVDRGTPPPAQGTQPAEPPAPATSPPDAQALQSEPISVAPGVAPPPAPQPMLRTGSQPVAPAHPGKHRPKSDTKDNSDNKDGD